MYLDLYWKQVFILLRVLHTWPRPLKFVQSTNKFFSILPNRHNS